MEKNFQLVKKFPAEEKYGFSSQLTCAAVSVTANIAEGSARMSAKDQAHFSQLAYSSLMESLCLVLLACDREWIAENEAILQRGKIESTSSPINSLRKNQLSRSR